MIPQHLDPGGDVSAYADCAADFLGQGIRNVIGCYTSSSRKEVIPLFEKRDTLLWYPTHYEGFESSANVIYTGAAPNHHISPLVDHLMSSYGSRAFCIGSNYIWAWESNRVLRDSILQKGGQMLAERYVAVGESDFSQIIDLILETQPDFIFNALIGSSSYAFFEEFRRACRQRGIDQPSRYPIASCNLSEADLCEIDFDCRDGHLSSSVYFSSLSNPENKRFVRAYRELFPYGPPPSAEGEAAYIAAKFLGASLAQAGTDEFSAVYAAAADLSMRAPQGQVTIDADTHHTYLTPRIGRSTCAGEFELVIEADAPVQPDPYLVSSVNDEETTQDREYARPLLRVVK